MKLEKMLRRAAANLVHKLNNIVDNETGPQKTESLLKLKSKVHDGFNGKVGFEAVLASSTLILGLFALAVANVAAAPLIPALLGMGGVGFGLWRAHRADQALFCQSRLDDKIAVEIIKQLDTENPPANSLRAIESKGLREQFKPRADAEARYEQLRQAVKLPAPKQAKMTD